MVAAIWGCIWWPRRVRIALWRLIYIIRCSRVSQLLAGCVFNEIQMSWATYFPFPFASSFFCANIFFICKMFFTYHFGDSNWFMVSVDCINKPDCTCFRRKLVSAQRKQLWMNLPVSLVLGRSFNHFPRSYALPMSLGCKYKTFAATCGNQAVVFEEPHRWWYLSFSGNILRPLSGTWFRTSSPRTGFRIEVTQQICCCVMPGEYLHISLWNLAQHIFRRPWSVRLMRVVPSAHERWLMSFRWRAWRFVFCSEVSQGVLWQILVTLMLDLNPLSVLCCS